MKPARELVGGRNTIGARRAQYWWRYDAQATDLYAAIEQLQFVWAAAQTAKYVSIVREPVGILFSHMTVVFPTESYAVAAVLNSTFHWFWIEDFCASLETRLRYIPTDGFETYPFPWGLLEGRDTTSESQHRKCDSGLCRIGEVYHEHRSMTMLTRQEGLTKTYNRFHNADEAAADIQKLRDLHVEMDNAVAAAYGWSDLDLGHGFHETKQGVRFTTSESARREALARLLKLNHERYAEEVAQGLHEPKARRAAGGKKRTRRATTKAAPALAAPALFDLTAMDTAFPSTDRDRLLCGLLCDLVAAQPGLPSTAYLDATVIVLRYKRHCRLLIGSEQTQFVALSGKLPRKCVELDERLPWTELVELLVQQDAVRKRGSALDTGSRLAEVRKAYPSLDARLIQLVHKAATTLREMQSLAKPKSAADKQVLSEFSDDVRTLCGASP